ncbi:SEC-C domain-containing protein [Curtobacterium flaccumfaciens pv. flaccumfaciens]|uniref:SEC-C domain-containing protein n=1 Tax=Curtobacterium poinsettiae TaxID=159612 RepID=UPI00217E3C45|nr:SEC-C domain-containing protein [Curtobacterium flaccumfaciens]MCS6566552.1 SEC-C domain-containing protein [Curtobacterium flaccumfaciens pv. flaccumfaciens]
MTASTTLDLIDEHFPPGRPLDPASTPGSAIFEFGEAVRSNPSLPVPRQGLAPIYIGGWPSSNFGLVNGDLLLSSLLYNDQVLIRDPIADWFSDDQYFVDHTLSARPGHRDLAKRRQNTAATRQFLHAAVAALRSMRPLIEAGIIGLVPSAATIRARDRDIAAFTTQLSEFEAFSPVLYSGAFSPNDIPVEDNVRGMFVFAPGTAAEPQVSSALKRGLTYFAREYTVAKEFGATYAAAFEHELYICRNGSLAMRPQSQVTEALLQSQLPIFQALTPSLIASIHDDDSFASFRVELHNLYESAPRRGSQKDLADFVADQEQVKLQPALNAAQRSAERGLLGRVGVSLRRGAFGIASGLVTDALASTGGLATVANATSSAIAGFFDKPARDAGQPVWTSLIRHRRTVTEELREVDARPGVHTTGWEIATEDPMSVTVTPGSLIVDFVPGAPVAYESPNGYQEGVYRTCWCGSGRKYKFCCERADRNWRELR